MEADVFSLDSARQLLTSNKPGSREAYAAVEAYGIDRERLRMEDLQTLSDKVKEGYQWGVIPVLGKAGSTVEGERLDLIRDTLRNTLDSDEQSNRSQAVEELERLAPKLQKEDALALAVDAIWGRSPTEQALRNLDVWKS